MPAPTPAFAFETPTDPFSFQLEPALNALHSMLLLSKTDMFGGLHEWVRHTRDEMTPEQRHTNLLVFEGLYHAVMPGQRWPDLPAYIAHLRHIDPLTLRDNVLQVYSNLPCRDDGDSFRFDTPEDMLQSESLFLDYLLSRFTPEHINLDIEAAAYRLLTDPRTMQETIVNHLELMWRNWVQVEWRRQEPLLLECIRAHNQVDYQTLSPLEVARQVTGKDLSEKWWSHLPEKGERRIHLVPSAHLGPYVNHYHTEDVIYLIFGARLPEGSQFHAPDLSRSELLTRLNALADDTRLRILELILGEEETCAQDIINELDMSQSAASRHLRQLSATGYLIERRRDAAKCYRINYQRLEDTITALRRHLAM